MSVNHFEEAEKNIEAYQGVVETQYGFLPIAQAATNMQDMLPIVKRFGQWAVCNDGSIQCLFTYYLITHAQLSNKRLLEDMSIKTWVNIIDFNDALEFAKSHF